jgi:succinate-semialdehyde dehydrogenase / glutarate-semialdehyde dehydrogenase
MAATFPVNDPCTGQVIARLPEMGVDEVEAAVTRASETFPSWAARPAVERADALKRWRAAILAETDVLADLMTAEQGKPLAEARSEVAYAASFVEWFAEEARRIYGDLLPVLPGGRRGIVLKQPVGVVAAITPWNFPAATVTRKVAPALAAGCTVLLKPSELTPLTAIRLAELAWDSGVPRDAFIVLTGADSPAIGRALTRDPRVRKISFTGSTRVGKLLLRDSAETVKRVSMELGGNAPLIVFDDADLDLALKGAMTAKFRNAGQTCICANRILVQRGIAEEFTGRLLEAVAALTLGSGRDDGVTIGPLITPAAAQRVSALVDEAAQRGAKVLTGGTASNLGGAFYVPTVVAGVGPDMRMANEEIFGPVAGLTSFDTDAEAIALANGTPYGLAAYLFSEDIGRLWSVTERLEVGMVGANEGAISLDIAPFGGVKESGLGREGSRYGIEEYLDLKFVCFDRWGSRELCPSAA